MREIDGYKVGIDGSIIGIKGKELKQYKNTKGYNVIKFKGTTIGVQIIVAKAYPEICGEWFEGCQVHHIDHNRTNNNAYNLIVVSQQEHIKIHTNDHPSLKAWNKGNKGCFSEEARRKMSESAKKRGKTWSRPVNQYALNGILIKEYESAQQANKETGVDFRYISDCCRGKQMTAGGYKWKFA